MRIPSPNSLAELAVNIRTASGERVVLGTVCRVLGAEAAEHPQRGADARLRMLTSDGQRFTLWAGDGHLRELSAQRRTQAEAAPLPVAWILESPQPNQQLWHGVVTGSLGSFSVQYTRGLQRRPGWRCEVYVEGDLVAVEESAYADQLSAAEMAREHVLPLTETGRSDPARRP